MRGGKYNPSCNFAVPALPALPEALDPAPAARAPASRRNEVKRTGTFKPVVTSPKPQDYVSLAAVPSDFTWCNVSGVNHCTTDLNQHIPQYAPPLPPPLPPLPLSLVSRDGMPQVLRQLLGARLHVRAG